MAGTEHTMLTAEQLQKQVVTRASRDQDLRSQFVADPKSTILDEYGIAVPNSINVKVHENSAQTIHVVLKANPALSEIDLAGAVGGVTPAGSEPIT